MSSGCSSTKAGGEVEVSPETLESAQRFSREYVLAAGDRIDVLVRGNEVVSRACTIRPDGFITLPIVRDVPAAGKTVSELAAHLTERLADRLNRPEVTVIGLDVRQPMVYVLGHVGVPQPVPLRNARTPAQAIAACGGLKDSAEPRDVAIIRLNQEGRLQAITLSSELQTQPIPYMLLNSTLLEAEDVIFVPESDRSQFVRAVRDYVNTPLEGLNAVLTPYFQFKLIAVLEEEN